MINIANPIYDVVFKYLLEDDEAARLLISKLIKKDIVSLTMRRNEYANPTHDRISIYRIDFAATVREPDGTQRLVTIELQKTWRPTETLRFRQYLGGQYMSRENARRDAEGYLTGEALPIITIYLLGHKVGDIEEPVIYVQRQYRDYDGNEITKGVPDPFVESLTHDSIIVQIPRLAGHTSNPLERLLNVFDQSRQTQESAHVLAIDESQFGKAEQVVINRLICAIAEPEVRQKMNVEDEIIYELETMDTKLMKAKGEIAAKEEEITQQKEQLTQQKEQLTQQKETILQMARMLLANGVSPESVADTVHLPVEEVRRLSEMQP